jgi:hypothetical protein
MVGARLEDCAEWLAQGLSIAPNGSKWPQRKKATINWQLGDRTGQLKNLQCGNQRVTPAKRKLWRGNQRITLAKRKNCGAAIGVLHRPKEKSWHRNQDIAPTKRKNCSAAIGVSCWPLEKNSGAGRSNQGIAPASSKFVQGLGIAPNGWCKA